MNKLFVIATAFVLLCLGSLAQANININTVRVGDAGNAADTASHSGNPAGQGSVSYDYNIGKYEVTAGQYTTFLNAVGATDTYALYSTGMSNTSYGCGITRSGVSGNYAYLVAADFVNRPVTFVSYWDSCRFANWLGNGQKTGAQDNTTTERGAYTLDGYNGEDGRTIQRNAGWTWAVTSEDEWYKAAYYKDGSTNAGYWMYATQSDTAPGRDMADPLPGNNANCYKDFIAYPIDSGKYTTVVGEFENSASAYGTFDQAGNAWEWNETVVYEIQDYAFRGQRGGSFASTVNDIRAPVRLMDTPNNNQDYQFGFRVVQAVPEPSSVVALLGGLVGLIGLRRRKA